MISRLFDRRWKFAATFPPSDQGEYCLERTASTSFEHKKTGGEIPLPYVMNKIIPGYYNSRILMLRNQQSYP
jgi:hypothetical protein